LLLWSHLHGSAEALPACKTRNILIICPPGDTMQLSEHVLSSLGVSAHCMQQLVRVSSAERMVLSPPWRVTVTSSTSDGVLVYSTRLESLRAQRLMWLRGYFRSILCVSRDDMKTPSRPISATTLSEPYPSSETRDTLNFSDTPLKLASIVTIESTIRCCQS